MSNQPAIRDGVMELPVRRKALAGPPLCPSPATAPSAVSNSVADGSTAEEEEAKEVGEGLRQSNASGGLLRVGTQPSPEREASPSARSNNENKEGLVRGQLFPSKRKGNTLESPALKKPAVNFAHDTPGGGYSLTQATAGLPSNITSDVAFGTASAWQVGKQVSRLQSTVPRESAIDIAAERERYLPGESPAQPSLLCRLIQWTIKAVHNTPGYKAFKYGMRGPAAALALGCDITKVVPKAVLTSLNVFNAGLQVVNYAGQVNEKKVTGYDNIELMGAILGVAYQIIQEVTFAVKGQNTLPSVQVSDLFAAVGSVLFYLYNLYKMFLCI